MKSGMYWIGFTVPVKNAALMIDGQFLDMSCYGM